MGTLANPTDANWYQITPTALTSYSGTLTVGVVPQDTSGVQARVAVFDAYGNELSAVVVTNEHGAFTVQLADQTPGTTYYIRVTAADPTGNRATGTYAVAASLTATAVTSFDALTAATLTLSTHTVYSSLTLAQGKLVQFSMTAATTAGAPAEAVRMTVVDVTGRTVFTLVAQAGDALATGTVWLAAGTYTVVLSAATRDGGRSRI